MKNNDPIEKKAAKWPGFFQLLVILAIFKTTFAFVREMIGLCRKCKTTKN